MSTVTDPPQKDAQANRKRARFELSKHAKDILITLAVTAGVIAFIYVFTYTPVKDEDLIKEVDYSMTLDTTRRAGAFPVAAPVGLESQGWVATSARYRPTDGDPRYATWHMGFISPKEEYYVGLEQTNNPADQDFLKLATGSGTDDGTMAVGADSWKKLNPNETEHRSIVLTKGGITTVLTGTATFDQLAEFAQTLRTS